MDIDVAIETEAKVSAVWIKRTAKRVLTARSADRHTELSIVLVGQERIIELNKQYLGRDNPTDVIAFSMLPSQDTDFVLAPDGMTHLGEVYISYPQAVIQAVEQGHSVEKELTILIIHGILHLYGYDDIQPEKRTEMQAREWEILSRIEGESN